MMSEELQRELDLIEQQVEQRAQERWQQRDEQLRGLEDSVRWMLLVPVWTEALARACGFPPDWSPEQKERPGQPARPAYESAGNVLEWLCREGLCQSREVPGAEEGAPPTREFWMPPDIRQRELLRLLEKDSSNERELREECQRLGLKLLEQPEALLPAPTRRWAELAYREATEADLAFALNMRIQNLLARVDDSTTPRDAEEYIAEAMSWVRTAQHLEPLYGSRLASAVTAATRRIDFRQVRRDDELRLKHYIPREEQLQAFWALASSPKDDKTWALHFVGKAGIGKTMLVRYLCTHVISQEQGFWARVDFDHLNPAYPTQAPWLLIEQLAEQLQLQGEFGRFHRELSWFDSTRLQVRELAGDYLRSWKNIQESSLWQDMIVAFANVLQAFDAPVFFLFDTCEELAKLTSGEEPANVSATFRLLEDLHQRVPRLRVLFFGRRPLASRGAGWHLVNALTWLPERNFLRLHEMQSFSRNEAARYFAHASKHRPSLANSGLLDAVLDKTREPPGPSPFVLEGKPPAPQPRFNPFEVVLYTDWIRGDDRVTPELLAQPGNNRYVELRIVERIRHPDLLAMLPLVALLGRFDEPLLRDTWRGAPESFESSFRELTRQEWIRNESPYYQVDEGLRPRIENYFRSTQPESIREASRRATDFLERFTTERPSSEVESFHYLLLAGLLRHDVKRAVCWWHRIEEGVIRTGGYSSISEVCAMLLADEGPLRRNVPVETAPFRAVVLATYAASLVHQKRPALAEWAEVERLAPKDDERLRIRALLGQLSAAHAIEETLDAARVQRLWTEAELWPLEQWDEQLQAAWVAALNAVIEQAEQAGTLRQLPRKPLERTATWAATEKERTALAGFALVTAARALVRKRKKMKSLGWFRQAMALVHIGPTAQRWLDWRAPEDLGARIRLDLLHALRPEVMSAEEALRFWHRADSGVLPRWPELNPGVMDQDRLCSALLQLEGAVRPAEHLARLLGTHGWRGAKSQYGLPDCNAHRAFPPSFIAHAQAIGESGKLVQALRGLRYNAAREEKAARSTAGAMLAEVALLGLSRRMRVLRESVAVEQLVKNPPLGVAFEQIASAWALLGMARPDLTSSLDQLTRNQPLESRVRHACWRALPVLNTAHAEHSLHWARRHLSPDEQWPEDLWTHALLLDAIEAEGVARQFGLRPPFEGLQFSPAFRFLRKDPAPRHLRLVLRAQVLGVYIPAWEVNRLITRVGPRAAAQAALDEGELLALRLPQQGAELLEKACQLFRRTHDTIGVLLSSLARTLALLRTPGSDLELLSRELRANFKRLPLRSSELWSEWLQEGLRAATSLAPPLMKLLDREEDWREVLIRVVAALVAIEDLRDGGSRFEGVLGSIGFSWDRMPTELHALHQVLRSSPWAGSTRRSGREPVLESRGGLLFSARNGDRAGMASSLGGTGPVSVALAVGEQVMPEQPVLFHNHPYQKTARGLRALFQSLTTIASWDGGEVAFSVEPTVAGVCWEAVVATALTDAPMSQLQLDLRRSSVSSYLPTPRVRPLKHVGIDTGDKLSKQRLARSWAVTMQSAVLSVLEVRSLETMPSILARVDLLHLMATPTPTARGPRLELRVGGHEEQRSTERERLVSAAELVSWMKDLRACVLMEPHLSDSHRVESDRLRAATARAFASELAATGQPTTVLVIPSLPEALAFAVLELAALAFGAQDWPEELARAVRHMRTRIFRELGETPDALETAMDVCLYLPPQSQLQY